MNHPERVIIDTNVLIVANERSPQATDECVIAAVDFLEQVRNESVLLLDSENEIYDEYRRYCSHSGQPGMGDAFFLHLHRSQANPEHVAIAEITPVEHSYAEVPATLSGFDKSDHKFIAVAKTCEDETPIVNCVDSDWSESAALLADEGVRVLELCPTCLKACRS